MRSKFAATILSAIIAGPASALTIMVPCPLPIAAMAPIHFASHAVKRHVVAHRHVGRKGAMHALHLVAAATMCAVWGEGFTNGRLADDYSREYGGGGDFEEGSGSDLGGDEGAGGGFGGGAGGGGGDVPPIFVVDFAPPLTTVGPTPPLTPTVPVPEPSTYALMLAGLASLALYRWRFA